MVSNARNLAKFHGVERKEPIPEPSIPKKPKNNPIQFTDTPITINLMEPNTEVPKESEKPKEEVAKVEKVEQPPARKSHHKKKIAIKVEPICLDTIYDQKYVPATPTPIISDGWVDDWEAPLDKKPKSKKRKAQATSEPNATDSNTKAHTTSEPNATGSNTVAKKRKARKRPMVGGEEKKPKTSTKPHLEDPITTIPILHLHAKKTPKAHAPASKEAEIKELGW